MSAFGVALLSQYYIKRHYPEWFNQYNYILGAGLDIGCTIAIISGFFIFKVFSFPIGHYALHPKGTPDYCYNAIYDK